MCLSAWCLFIFDGLWKAVVCFQQLGLLIGNSPGACDALLCMSHTLKSAVESGQEARILQIDFSAAFDSVNHRGIFYLLCYVGIGDSVLSILTQFLSNRSLHVMVNGCRSKLVNAVSGVLLGVFWTRNCSSCNLRRLFSFWKIS